ncbi:hypothetical protein HIM_04359 [Hirsutella minnesotensis 3608]|uniref:Peroxin/Ferlin domain-containing protein n=1 Tax=Hirsutella minnesotensis 3608 TaxID=1043627 RepID=A0A0F8A1K0_9HYPO|nr:hypothetical protein HIM_04359 [Hirsutella minnesotensis 3608]
MLRVRSSRRAAGLKPSDYDHEIGLVNHDEAQSLSHLSQDAASGEVSSATRLVTPAIDTQPGETDSSPTAENRQAPEQQRAEQAGRDGHDVDNSPEQQQHTTRHESAPDPPIVRPSIEAFSQGPVTKKKLRQKRQSAIDILYENERGGFLCGVALFSSKALGGLDPTAWTNAYHKASPTDIHTAQVPDPSWDWVWPEWRINHDDGVDEHGWEYSFAFSKKFSWHKAKWWSSFVRRRVWIRKRVQKRTIDMSTDPHMLNTDYFRIRPASHQKRLSNGSMHSSRMGGSKSSMSQLSESEMEEKPDIEDMETLLWTLRHARIDREKREAVINYLNHAPDLSELQDEMHEIMSLFIFQASRRQLLSHLMRRHDDTMKELGNKDDEEKNKLRERKEALDAAIKHAEEEVTRLAYWSDVKQMAQDGELRDSLDSEQGWFDANSGLDQSGPPAPNKGKLPG